MELEDLRSDLIALEKLYGLVLQPKGNSILQVGTDSHENLDDKSRQMLKKLLDEATEEAFQSHSKIIKERPSAFSIPDSSQVLHDLPITSKTKPCSSMQKEILEEIDHEKSTQMTKNNHHVHRRPNDHHSRIRRPTVHLSKPQLVKHFESREEAQGPRKDPSILGPQSDSASSMMVPPVEISRPAINYKVISDHVPSHDQQNRTHKGTKKTRTQGSGDHHKTTSQTVTKAILLMKERLQEKPHESNSSKGHIDVTQSKLKMLAPPTVSSSFRHRVDSKMQQHHHMAERAAYPHSKSDRITSRVNARGPSHLERVLSGRVQSAVKDKKKPRDRSMHSYRKDPARLLARNVGQRPTLEKRSTRILSSSGPVIDPRDPHQRLRRHLTWKEKPRRMNRQIIQETSSTSCTTRTNSSSSSGTACSSLSRNSDWSSTTTSRRFTRADRPLPAANPMLTQRQRRTLARHVAPTSKKLPQLPPPPPSRQKSLTKPHACGSLPNHREKSPRGTISDRRKAGPQYHVGPTISTNRNHQVEEGKREGRLKRIKNKLAIIFHHHHHHYHHDHHVKNGQDDVNADSPGRRKHDHDHGYLGDMIHHPMSKEEEHHMKLAAEVRGEREARSKSVVMRARPPRERKEGNFRALVDRLLRHLQHSKNQKKKGLGKSGSRKVNNNKKEMKIVQQRQHWWQRLYGRSGGVKLANSKNSRLPLKRSDIQR